MKKEDIGREKEALREGSQYQDRKFPPGIWELLHSPSRQGEGQKDLGPFCIFLSSFYWRKQSSPQPGGEPQNSPRTSQNLWEGSFYTFLQATPNPKISEYLEVLGWESRFSCVKGSICIPKIGGTPVSRRMMMVSEGNGHSRMREMGGRVGSQPPEDLGGFGCLPIPVLEELQ